VGISVSDEDDEIFTTPRTSSSPTPESFSPNSEPPRRNPGEPEPTDIINLRLETTDRIQVVVEDEIHDGSLWQTFKGSLRHAGPYRTRGRKDVIIKVAIPYWEARDLFLPEETYMMEEAIFHEHYIYTEQLKDLQGKQIPKYHGLFFQDIQNSKPIRMYVMILEKVEHVMNQEDRLWQLKAEQK
jgi:hypothetical protein